MSIHMQKQMDKVKRMLFSLAGDAEHALVRAIQSVQNFDVDIAREVIENDAHIDQGEIDVEEECLHALALEQPLAMDLRFVVAVLKMNNDIERIGDLAVNIAEQSIALSKEPSLDVFAFMPGMGEEVLEMLRSALDALLQLDVEQADNVRAMDDRVDEMHKRCFSRVEEAIRDQPDRCSQYIHVLSVSRNLERAADLATNIAEDVIYLVRGEIQRHKVQLVEKR